MEEGDAKYIHIGSVRLRVNTNLTGKVRVGIRSEDIIIVRDKLSISAQNVIPASITEIFPRGSFVKIILNACIH